MASVVCACVLLAAAMPAGAGAYAEAEQPEELPETVDVGPSPPEPDPPDTYWYAQLGATYAIGNFDAPNYDDAAGFNLRGGRRFSAFFAAEVTIEHVPSDYDNNAGDDVEAWNTTASGKVFPIRGQFQPFAIVGVGYGQADRSGDNNGGVLARFGVGMDMLITDGIGVAAEAGYLLGTGSMSDWDQIPLSLGVFYNFL